MFSVKGNLLANGLNLYGTGSSTIAGILQITASSTVAGYRICTQQNNVCPSPWSSSGGLTTLSTASDLVGIGTSTPAEKLSLNGGAFFDSDIIRYGSSSQPTLLFKYAASSTSTIPQLKNAFSFATSTNILQKPILTLDGLNGRVGIGTTSPIRNLSIGTGDGGGLWLGSPRSINFTMDGGGTGSRAIYARDSGSQLWRILLDAAIEMTDTNDLQANIRADLSAQNDDGWVTATIDYAEFMEKLNPQEDIQIYDVIGIKNGKITKNTEGAVLTMITSTDAGIRGGNPLVEGYSRDDDPNWLAVAYIGQMPVLVEGEVNEGDYIIPSGNNDGRAKAASPNTVTQDQFNQAIGRALESDDNPVYNAMNVYQDPNDPGQDSEIFFELEKMQQRRGTANIINVAVGTHMGWPKLDSSISEGQVQGEGWSIDQTTGKLTTTYGLDLGGNSIQNVSAILSASGKWRIEEDGKLVVEEVRAKKGTFEEKLEVGSQEKPIGVTIFDKITGLPYCSSVINGVAQLEQGICESSESVATTTEVQ